MGHVSIRECVEQKKIRSIVDAIVDSKMLKHNRALVRR